MSAKQAKRLANIFDLPLELRQQIYRECIPQQRGFRINDYTADNTEGLRTANLRIAREFQEEQIRVCDLMRFVVLPKRWTTPSPIQNSKVYMICIHFGHYTLKKFLHPDELCPCAADSAIRKRRLDQISLMQENIRAFVCWAQISQLAVKYLMVRFRGRRDPDPHWCKAHVNEEMLYGGRRRPDHMANLG